MAEITAIVSGITGLTFPEARRPFSEAAIRRIVERSGSTDLGAFTTTLRSDPKLQRAVIDELIVGETYFFRDPEQFAYLRSTVLPEIAARLPHGATMSVWCAGCATGEEAYSLAMVLDNLGFATQARVIATDLSSLAISRARAGSYTRWSFRVKATPWRDRWFTFRDNAWHARPELRERVQFEVFNLVDFANGVNRAQYDLILCRNVLMYLEPVIAARVTAALAHALAPGGWLLTSPSDPPPAHDAGLEATITPAGILYRRRDEPQHEPIPQAAARIDRQLTLANAAPPDERELDPQIHVTLAMMLLDLHLPEAAIAAARRAIFLDRTLAVAYFALGRALRQIGKLSAARRALHRAQTLLAKRSSDDVVRCAEAISVGALAANTAAELSLL